MSKRKDSLLQHFIAPPEYGLSHTISFQKAVLLPERTIDASASSASSVRYFWLIYKLPQGLVLVSTPESSEGERAPEIDPDREGKMKPPEHEARARATIGHLSLAFAGIDEVNHAVERLGMVQGQPICRIMVSEMGERRKYSKRSENIPSYNLNTSQIPLGYSEYDDDLITSLFDKWYTWADLDAGETKEMLSAEDEELFIFTEAEGMEVWGDVIGEAYMRKRVLDLKRDKLEGDGYIGPEVGPTLRISRSWQ